MSKHIQLSIGNPCHENWDDMTPVEQGRFCASCQKPVMDFSNMNDSQLATFFKKPIPSSSKEGSVCGRFYNDQLDRDIEIPKKRIPWVKYFFQFALPAFLVSMKATAQGKSKTARKDTVTLKEIVMVSWPPKKMPDVNAIKPEPNVTFQLQGRAGCPMENNNAPSLALAVKSTPQLTTAGERIYGKVSNEKGESLPYATVVVKGTNNAVASDMDGNFNIKRNQPWQPTTIVISYVGYMLLEIEVAAGKTTINAVLYPSPDKGGVVFVGIVLPKRKRKKSNPIPLLTQKLMDTASKLFRVFPNPVNAGTSLHIEWKETEEGYYLLDLVDLSGKKIFSKETWIDREARVLNLEIPSVAPGNYFLKATNKNSGKSFTEKIIVQ